MGGEEGGGVLRKRAGGRGARAPPARAAGVGKSPPPGRNSNPDDLPRLVGGMLSIRRVAIAAAVGLAAFALYVSTVFPSIPGGDATELAFCACQKGVAHPPGYPLFTMIASYFVDHWPYGTPALRANVAAAACGGGAASLMFLAVEAATRSEAAGVLCAGMFATCRLVWFYSIQSEVFSLNNLIAAALLYVLVLFDEHQEEHLVYVGAFVCGLGLTNQHTIIFYVAPTILYVIWNVRDKMLTPRKMAAVILVFLVALTPYAYLPWASKRGLPGSWGDTSTVMGFLTHLLRKEYGTFRLFSGQDQADSRFVLGMTHYLRSLLEESRYVGGVLLALGSGLAGWKGRAKLPGLQVVVCLWWFYTCAFHGMANLPIESALYLGVQARFWMQSFVAAFIVMGAGAECLLRVLRLDRRPALAMAAVIACVGGHVASIYSDMDEGDNTLFVEYGKTLLDPLPQGARMIVKGDVITNTVRYLQRCEGYRADVQVVDQAMLTYGWFLPVQGNNFPSMVFPGTHYHPYEETSFSMKMLIDANIDSGQPLFMAGGWHEEDFSHQGHYEHQPFGMVDKVVRADQPLPSYERWFEESSKLLPNYTLPTKHYKPERWEAVCIRDYYQTHHKVAYASLTYALKTGDMRGMEDARRIIEWAVERHPPTPPSYYFRNLGIAYQRLTAAAAQKQDASEQKTLHRKMIAAFSRYLELGDPSEGGYSDVKAVVASGGL